MNMSSYSSHRVSWTSANVSNPTVRWGRQSGQYLWSSTASSFTYSADDLCGAPATTIGWRSPGILHHAILDGLEPNHDYFYTFGSEETGWSSERRLHVPPAPGRQASVNILAYGDMGKSNRDGSLEHWPSESPSLNTTKLMEDEVSSFDLVLQYVATHCPYPTKFAGC